MAFTMRLNRELERQLNDLAAERGMRRADLIEAILRQWVAEARYVPGYKPNLKVVK